MEVIKTHKTVAFEAAGKALEQWLEPGALLLVSGGSSLKALEVIKKIPDGLVIGLVDERYSDNSADLNWTAFAKTRFFSRAESKGALFLPIPVSSHSTPKVSGEQYGEALRKLLAGAKPPVRVIGLFGIGADAHIAGVMPYPEKEKWFNDTFLGSNLAVGYDGLGKNPHRNRVTTTLNFIRDNLTHAIAAAVGPEKKAAIDALSDPIGSLNSSPARILREIPHALVFTD